MFNSLTGTITGKYPQKLFIETHGIEWDVTVPDSALDKLPPVGQQGRVYTYLQHTDALMVLYGFASENDRSLFFDLLKVDGIGPKGAVKIMGNIDTPALARILDSGDLAALEKVPGVGKKTAAKMLLQLKGKLTLEETVSVPKVKKVPFADVVSGLADMGYDRKTVEQVIVTLSDSLKEDAAFQAMSESEKEAVLFRKAIVELS